MMNFNDFYKLAKYANEAWKGSYTDEEIAENAHDYTDCYNGYGCESFIIQELIKQLIDDGSDEAIEFLKNILEGDEYGRSFTFDLMLDSVDDTSNIDELAQYITTGDKLGLYGVGDKALDKINELRGDK